MVNIQNRTTSVANLAHINMEVVRRVNYAVISLTLDGFKPVNEDLTFFVNHDGKRVAKLLENGRVEISQPSIATQAPRVEVDGEVFYLSRLVYKAFIGELREDQKVHRKDRDFRNTSASNLYIGKYKTL